MLYDTKPGRVGRFEGYSEHASWRAETL